MHRLRSGAEDGALQLDEIADACAFADVRLVAEVRERADRRAGRDRRVGDHAVVVHGDAVADPRIDDPHAAVDLAAAADRRLDLRARRRDG